MNSDTRPPIERDLSGSLRARSLDEIVSPAGHDSAIVTQRRKNTRVLHVLRAPLGGAFRHVFDLMCEQFNRGVHVGLVCDETIRATSTLDRLDCLATKCALGVTRLRIPRRPSIRDVASLRSIRNQFAADPPDVIHGHGAKGAAYSRILARGLKAISICTPHGGSLHYSYRTIAGAAYLFGEKILSNRTSGMIFESAFARQEYEEKVGKLSFPYQIIHNGLHDSEFVPIRAENAEYDFVFVGEFRSLKGIYSILEAARILKRQHSFRILMVGSGPDEPTLRRRIAKYGLTKEVTVAPPIHPARAAFAQGRFVLAPSLRESMPYIVLEAIAAQRPVLTTAVGGIPEIFGRRGDLLLAAGDSAMLSKRMKEMLTNPVSAIQAAAELHEHARNHVRVTQMERDVFDFYETIRSCSTEIAKA